MPPLIRPHVVRALIQRYLGDEVLRVAYNKVALIAKGPLEDETQFADRLTKAVRDCSNAFNEDTLVLHYVHGLLPTPRKKDVEDLRRLSTPEECSLTALRRLAQAAGATYRAQFAVAANS